MTRANFAPLKLHNGDVFAVKVSGHLGARQKIAVEALVGRCIENGKTKVLLDLSELSSMGGAVAQVFGDFTSRLNSEGYTLQLVGASDVVQSFLRGRCSDAEPNFVDTVDEAMANLNGAASVKETAEPAVEVAIALEEAELPEANDGSSEPAAEPGIDRYISLEEADRWFGEAENAAQKKSALMGLLFGADLADTCYLLHRSGDRLVETEDESLYLPYEGGVARVLLERRGPVPIVDLGDCSLDPVEEELLTRLNCQMAVPLFEGDQLDGILFLRKEHAGTEYGPGEALALDLLLRYVGRRSAGGAEPVATDRESRELKERIYRHQTLARISKDLNSIHDEEHLINIILITLMSEMGASTVAYYDSADDQLQPRAAKGIELEELSRLSVDSAKTLIDWSEILVAGRGKGSRQLQKLLKGMGSLGFTVLAPMRTSESFVGCVALGGFRGDDDAQVDMDYLQSLLQHAGVALMNTQAFRSLHSQTLRISRKIMGLAERRAGLDSGDQNDHCVVCVSSIARAMNYPPEEMRDLIFATVLRDIGMIEISDVVLRSPRKLSPEEWKLVQRHPIHGAEILRGLDFSEATCGTVMHHHERYNGEGYPNGLRGNTIPAGARMISVVESYLAMTRELPYRAALSKQEAIEVLMENWEMRYDPEVIGAFIEILKSEDELAELSIDELLSNL